MHASRGHIGVGGLEILEHPDPQPVAVLQHIGLVGHGQGAAPGLGPGEGSFQQATHGLLGMHRQIHGATGLGGTLKAVGPLGVLTEDLKVEAHPACARKGPAGAEVHRQFQALAQAQQDLLGVASIRHARITHGPEEDGIEPVAQIRIGRLRQGLPRGEEVLRTIGQPHHLQAAPPCPGPGRAVAQLRP